MGTDAQRNAALPMASRITAAPRIVLDTNVSLALFAWQDPDCCRLFAALREGRLRATGNHATRSEWHRVLGREALRLGPDQRERAAQAFDALVDVLDPPRIIAVALPRCRDADDQIFLELARDAGAVALYSRDRELLRLSRRTRRQAGFRVLRPEEHAD